LILGTIDIAALEDTKPTPYAKSESNMGLFSLLWFLLIGLIAGWLAGQITKGRSFGLVNDLIVGVIGALLGGVLFWLIGLSATGLIGSLIMATVGAIVFLYLLRTFRRRF
jgi:uncharacterized membrane protein YeaQ/YmgE (transglycosylase-associated protein family)